MIKEGIDVEKQQDVLASRIKELETEIVEARTYATGLAESIWEEYYKFDRLLEILTQISNMVLGMERKK